MKKRGIAALALTLSLVLTVGAAPAADASDEVEALNASRVSTEETEIARCAQRLVDLGVFQGTGDGLELDRTTTRSEGIVMLVRLMGGETDAQSDAMTGMELQFTDVDDWFHGYVAYAWSEKLTNGTGETSFGSRDPIDATMYAVFLLRCLNYTDGGEEPDFAYQEAIPFAVELGLFTQSYGESLEERPFDRGELARMSCLALEMTRKGEKTTLLDHLVDQGKITESAARAFRGEDASEPSESGQPSGGGSGGSGSTGGSGGTTPSTNPGVSPSPDPGEDEAPSESQAPTEDPEPSESPEPGETSAPDYLEGIPCYTANPWCPDFGALHQISPVMTVVEHGVWNYVYGSFSAQSLEAYRRTLTQAGFAADPELAAALTDFDQPEAYRSPDGGTVVLDVDKTTGYLIIAIM